MLTLGIKLEARLFPHEATSVVRWKEFQEGFLEFYSAFFSKLQKQTVVNLPIDASLFSLQFAYIALHLVREI